MNGSFFTKKSEYPKIFLYKFLNARCFSGKIFINMYRYTQKILHRIIKVTVSVTEVM